MTAAPQRQRVLIVDDDLSLRILVRAAVEAGGFEAFEAESGDAALALFDEHPPDVVLLDVVMPGLDGYQTCDLIKHRARGDATPVLMMTGLDDVSSIERAYEVGATDFITKPINGTLLIHRLRYLLRASGDARAAKEGAHRLAQAQRLARLVQWEYHPDTQRFRWSDEVFEVFGIPPASSENIGELLRWVHPDDRAGLLDVLNSDRPEESEYRLVVPGGSERTIHQQVDLITEPATGQRRLIGAAQDVTERRRAEQRAAQLAYYDSLTGLPNRALLKQYVDKVSADARRHGQPMAILAIDLDLFKRVNDSYGHAAGDALLVEAARRITGCLRPSDTTFRLGNITSDSFSTGETLAARLGGDEFIAVLPRIHAPEDAAIVARRLLDALAAAYPIDNSELSITASIGISVLPDNGVDVDALFRCADAAMYHAKEAGRNNYQFFTDQMHEASRRRIDVEDGLRTALATLADSEPAIHVRNVGGLHLRYQPKIATHSQRVVGFEALARWDSPTLGPVTPAEFIRVAEDSGLIIQLGEWILRDALTTLRSWMDACIAVPVAVNISARQFRDPNFATQIRDLLRQTGVSPDLLELELTESIVMADTAQSHQVLTELKHLGVRFAIDDFGTGYSSLSYLTRFPFDILKIDQSFISLIGQERNDAILTAIIAISRSLGLDIVAEGVENQPQLDFLNTFGALDIQGYYYAKPMTADAIAPWFTSRSTPPLPSPATPTPTT